MLFGLAPAFRGTRVAPAAALKEGTRSSSRETSLPGSPAGPVQVTLSLVLIAGAGLFTRTLHNLRSVDVGYDRENILMFSVNSQLAGYPRERARELYGAIVDEVETVPGVESASLSIARPVDDQYDLVDTVSEVDGRRLPPSEVVNLAWNSMSPGYFSTIGTPLRKGRDFNLYDAAPVPKS